MKVTEEDHEAKAFLIFCISATLSSVSLVFWILLQWMIGELIQHFRLSNIDSWWLSVLQWLFAISTFIPIASYIIRSSALSIIQTWRTVRDELKQ